MCGLATPPVARFLDKGLHAGLLCNSAGSAQSRLDGLARPPLQWGSLQGTASDARAMFLVGVWIVIVLIILEWPQWGLLSSELQLTGVGAVGEAFETQPKQRPNPHHASRTNSGVERRYFHAQIEYRNSYAGTSRHHRSRVDQKTHLHGR